MKKTLYRLAPSLFLAALPATVFAAGSIDSNTMLRLQQNSHVGTRTQTLMPLTESVAFDADKLGDGNLSAHFYGWGRLDLADHQPGLSSNQNSTDGSLTYGYVQYRFGSANARARAGRFSVMEGVVNEQVDGVSFRTDLPYGFGVSTFGGATVHTTNIPGTDTDGKGDGLFGGRVNYRMGGKLEVGFSGVYESKAPTPAPSSIALDPLSGGASGNYGSHRLVGGDIWLAPTSAIQFSGHTSYNTETANIAEHSYLLQVAPYKGVTLSGSFDEYHDRDYFYSSYLFSEMIRDLSQKTRVIGGTATYATSATTEVSADYKHYSRDIGQASRFGGEARGTFLNNSLRSGVSYHYLRSSADFAADPSPSTSGSHHELRGYVLYDTKTYFTSFDLTEYLYKKPVENKSAAWEATGSLGYHLTPSLALSSDLSYGQNPQYTNEAKGLIRLVYSKKIADKGDSK